MAKYVARVRKDANSYRYFYTPAEYQAYVRSKGQSAAKTAADITAKVASTVGGAKKKISKYVYNKNASKKLNEMGKAHEIDEKAKRMEGPQQFRDRHNMNSTVNRRTYEAVYGGKVHTKKGDKNAHIDPDYVAKGGETYSSPNVGKMQDAITKSLKDQQHKNEQAKEQRKKYVTNQMNTAADKRAYNSTYVVDEAKSKPFHDHLRISRSGPAADAMARTKEAEAKRAQTRVDVATNRMNENRDKRSAGPAADAMARTKEAEAKRTQTRMNKAINDRGAEYEAEVRRREYDERQLGIPNEPKYYKPSSSELLYEFNKKQAQKKQKQAYDKRAEGYAQEALAKQDAEEMARKKQARDYKESKVVSVKDTEERMKNKNKKKYIK